MSWIGDIARLFRVGATFSRNGAVEPVLTAMGMSPLRRRILKVLAIPLWPFGIAGAKGLPSVARSLSALGPSYVKFGQILSTRPDFVGDEMSVDLSHLQDRLPAFSDRAARKMVEQELGRPISEMFETLGPPVAAASIAQVHRARTRSGRDVAVKVLRPNIEDAFRRDISAFYFVARLLERVAVKSRRLRPTTVVAHFESVVTREMDLRLEAAAGSEYSESLKDTDGFRTPGIVWDLSARRVLTTEWVDGDRLADLDALRARELDLPDLGMRVVRVFLRTALRDGFFHADLHQGNLKVGSDGALVAFDFGIMGRIDAKTRRTYAEILYSYLTRDYRRGAQAHFDAGYVSRDHDLDHFAQALRSIGEPIVGQQASRISMARVLQQLFDVTEQFGMETRPELILLQRTMVVVEGVARSLDPDFNMWEAARPEVEKWMRENIGPKAVLRDTGVAIQSLARLGPQLPQLAERFVEIAENWEERRAPRIIHAAPAPTGRQGFGYGLGMGFGAAVGVGLGLTLFAFLWPDLGGLLDRGDPVETQDRAIGASAPLIPSVIQTERH